MTRLCSWFLIVVLTLAFSLAQVAAPRLQSRAFAVTSTPPPVAVNPVSPIQTVSTPGPTTVSTDISQDTVWGPVGSPYVLRGTIRINKASLTMLPGTVVKFDGVNTQLVVWMESQLLVLGTRNEHVVLTSFKDDTVLGDTNRDGAATVPAPGDWQAVRIYGGSTLEASTANNPGSVIDWADIRFGGYNTDPAAGEVQTSGRLHFVMANSTLTDTANAGYGSLGDGNDTPAAGGGSFTGLYSNTFARNNSDLQIFYARGDIIGNTLGVTNLGGSFRGAGAYLSYPRKVRFWFNQADGFVTVNGTPRPTRAQADVRFNQLVGGAGGWYPSSQDLNDWTGNWWGRNINDPLPTCMTPAEAAAFSPPVETIYDGSCPTGQQKVVGYTISAAPGLSGLPQTLSAAAREAMAPRFGPVNTFSGALTYQATDLSVADAGKSIDVSRTFRSDRLTSGDAGAGWRSAFGESLALSPGLATMSFSDGSAVGFATDPAAGYTPAPGVAADYSTGASGTTVTGPDQTGYTFDPTGELTSVALGDDGHQLTIAGSAGQADRVTGVSGRYVQYTRGAGKLTAVADGNGRSVALSYAGGQLISATGVDGNAESYGYDPAGRLIQVTTSTGMVKLKAAYGSDGRALWVELPGTGRTTFGYDDANSRRTLTDANGIVTTQEYDADGRLLTERVGGTGTHVVYGGNGRPIASIAGIPNVPMTGYGPAATLSFTDGRGDETFHVDPTGVLAVTSYTLQHQPLSTYRSDATTVSRTYDAQHRLSTSTDPLGKVWSYSYNSFGELTGITDPLNRTRSATFAANGDPATTTDESGAVSTFTTDALGRVTDVGDPLGHHKLVAYTSWSKPSSNTSARLAVTSVTYDNDRRPTAVTDPLGTSRTEYDTAGRISATVDANGARTVNSYDPAGRLLTTTDPRGKVTSYSYTTEGWLGSVTDAAGAGTSFSYDPAGRVHRVTDALGAVRQDGHDRAGRVTDTWTPDGAHTTNRYDLLGRTSEVITPRGLVSYPGYSYKYGYDAAGRRVLTTAPSGSTTAHSYDAIGRAAADTDELGTVTSYAYDDTQRTVTTSDALGPIEVRRVDAAGNVAAVTDGAGGTLSYGYDADDNATSRTDALGTARSEYDLVGNVTASVDPDGRRTTFTYDPASQLKTRAVPGAGSETFSYDLAGNLTDHVDRTTGRWVYGYDAVNHLQLATDPLGHITTYDYDLDGRTSAVTDPTGVVTRSAYDSVGRPAVQWDSTGASWVTHYDLDGNVADTLDPDGARQTYSYNTVGDRTGVRSGSAAMWTYTFDAAHRITAQNEGTASSFEYDIRGRRTATLNGLAQRTTATYDGAGRELTSTTPGGAVTAHSYDATGRVRTTTDPLGKVATNDYFPSGLLKSTQLPRAGTFQYTYDTSGRLLTETNPLLAKITYGYDNESRPKSVTYPSKRVVSATYDLAGRQSTSTAGSLTRSYSYDNADRLTGATGTSAPALSFTYDSRGLPATSVATLGTTSYGYTPGARLASRTTPDGAVLNYSYNDRGLLATMRGAVSWDYSYNTAGQLTTRSGVSPTVGDWSESNNYDAAGRRTKVTGGAPSEMSYTPDGQLATVSEPNATVSTKKVTSYTYDSVGHLKSAAATQNGVSLYSSVFGYDDDGNRTSTATVGKPTVTGTFDLADKLTATSDGVSYTYNADGQQTKRANKTFGYNTFGELTSTNVGGSTVTNTRDPLGRVATRTLGNSTEKLSYDGLSPSLAASQIGTGPITGLLRDPDGTLVAEATVGNAPRSVARNLHGDIVALKDHNANTVRWTGSYDTLGKQTTLTGSAAVTLGFQSMYQDGNSGLVDMAARTYDPTTSRFTVADNVPGGLDNPSSLNRYGYGYGDPVNHVDLNGHWPGWVDDAASSLVGVAKQVTHSVWDEVQHATQDNGGTAAQVGSSLSSTGSHLRRTASQAWQEHGSQVTAFATAADMTGAGNVIRHLVVDDFQNCANGSASGCVWAATNFFGAGTVKAAGKGLRVAAKALRSSPGGSNVGRQLAHHPDEAIETPRGLRHEAPRLADQAAAVGDDGVQSVATAATGARPPARVNVGGEGEVRGAINVQHEGALHPSWGASRTGVAGKSLAELAEAGDPYVVASNGALPFGSGSIDEVLTNSVRIGGANHLGQLYPQPGEIWRILGPQGRWLHDGIAQLRP